MTSSERNDTNFLRALAICLITNSHMDDFYPIKLLATGGMIGNSLFFMLAALGLYLSWQEKGLSKFESWYGRRLSRIYPSICAIVILITFPHDIYMGLFRADTFLLEIGKLFYPPFWFLQALLLYYVFIYFILKNFSNKSLLFVATPVILFYTLYYVFYLDLSRFSIESHFFRVIFYFFTILWGLYLGSIKEKINFEGIWDIVLLFLCISVIYAHKYLMYRGIAYQLQFIQHLAVIPFLYYALKVAKSHFIMTTVMNNSFLGKPIKFISTITLEIFIVGNSMDSVIAGLKLDFPLNSILYVISIAVLASIIYLCSQRIRKIFIL